MSDIQDGPVIASGELSMDPPLDGLARRARDAAHKRFDVENGDRQTKMCMLAFTSPTQEPDGAVRLCSASSTFGYAAETDMGNYQTDGLATVWRGEKYRHLRKTLITGEDLEPYCAGCEYRFSGPAWLFQLHLALWANETVPGDPEVLGMIRRWSYRYPEYAEKAPALGLGVHALPEIHAPGPNEPLFNEDLPNVLIEAGQTPVLVDFNTLNRCNVSCVMCPPALMHDDKGVKRDEYFRLSIEEFDRVCSGLNVRTAHFVGAYAEPLLNKDIFKLVARAKNAGAFTAITTNATVLVPRFAENLLDAGLDMMTVSLHGATAKTAESIMRKSEFERVVGNIRNLQEAKRQRGTHLPEIYFNFVSQRANVEEIPDFIRLAGDLGVRHVHIIHLIDGGLDDKSTNLIHFPELLGPAIIEAKRLAAELGVHAYVSPAYTDIVARYEASLAAGG